MRNNDLFDEDKIAEALSRVVDDEENEETGEAYQEPAEWTIITALERVLALARDSQLSDKFWKACNSSRNTSSLCHKKILKKIRYA